ncbi:DUF3137 domain-containing protein [Chitinophaga sp. MM2321]|uniref:DUF3137 domain-containing protein n=1 Tax=Chitinophaga sp. MM2321 TaxID=3137178 RepID=UPI0032D59867
MKTLEEFNAFADQHLSGDLQQLESQRIAGRSWLRWMWLPGILPVVLFFFFVIKPATEADAKTVPNTGVIMLYLVGGVLLALIVSFGLRYFMKRLRGAQQAIDYQQDFKYKIVKPIIAFINPGYAYQPLNHASREEFTESGLFAKRDYRVTGNDQISGRAGDLHFQCCDLKVTHMPLVTLRGRGADVVFEGSYFIAQFPRHFNIPVYVISRSTMMDKLLTGTHAESSFIETWSLGKKVLPADAAFNKLFMTYSPDVEAAQQLLTPVLMQKITALQERSSANIFISFYNNRIYIGISHGVDYFEAGLHQSLTNRQLLAGFYLDFTTLLQLVDDLQQNAGIWTSTAFSRS